MNKRRAGFTILYMTFSLATIVSFQNCNRVTFSSLDPEVNAATGHTAPGGTATGGTATIGIDPADGTATTGTDPADGTATTGNDPANGTATNGTDPATGTPLVPGGTADNSNGTPTNPDGTPVDPGTPGVCDGISCDLVPITTKNAVTTILLALGDQVDDQLVIKGVSAQLIAESVVRYTSPKVKPKILFVHDPESTDESANDAAYVAHELLARYDVTAITSAKSGLTTADLAGYDLVWFNNPGFPMGSARTRDALLKFTGGVVIEGDDLSQGAGFDITELTGLKNIDNGTSIQCGGKSYDTDNNQGAQFKVSLSSELFTGASKLNADFVYGNDIDLTTPARSDLEVLAYAKGSPSDCTEKRPAIVRYVK